MEQGYEVISNNVVEMSDNVKELVSKSVGIKEQSNIMMQSVSLLSEVAQNNAAATHKIAAITQVQAKSIENIKDKTQQLSKHSVGVNERYRDKFKF